MTSRIWFITGVSRGFGKALAETALARGDTVIGTTRDGAAPLAHQRLQVLPLDVADAAAVPAAVARAAQLGGRLDVVVNNAGFGLISSAEEATEADIERLLEVNFHGTRRVIRAALPLLRKQRAGHIVNITSIAGVAPSAGSAFYAAAKFAVEGMSLSLAQELAPLGIKLTLVEPGAFRTDFLSEHSIRITPVAIEDYAATAGAALARLQSIAGSQAGDPVKAAQAILAAVDAEAPPLHLLLGADAYARAQARHERFGAELERWKAVSLSTGFDA